MQFKSTFKRYLKWYSIPLIYFLLTSLSCAYAWYTRPISYRAGIKVVFEKISLIPTLILTATITAWIVFAILLIPISFWLKKRSPNLSIFRKSVDLSQKEDSNESHSKIEPINFWSKTVNVAISVLGIILIVSGLSIAAWISRPYITFLFSTSKIEELENKAELLGQVQRDTRNKSEEPEKIAEVLPKDRKRKSEAQEKATEVPIQVQGNAIKKDSTLVEQIAEILQKEKTDKVTALEKEAETIKDNAENRIIIPTALVEAPILEGIDMEKLSEGVCHITESSVPGQGGNCIIEGHNLGEFGWWRPQGPFNMLEIMEKGIRIYVFYKGEKYSYRVKEKIYTTVDDPRLYDFSPGERLTLITCTSSLNPTLYTDKRTVIVAYPQ